MQFSLIYQNFGILKFKGLYFFLRFYSWVDIALATSNFTICYYIFYDIYFITEDLPPDEMKLIEKDSMQIIRMAGVFTTALLSFRMTYILKLIDSIAPLIDIIG